MNGLLKDIIFKEGLKKGFWGLLGLAFIYLFGFIAAATGRQSPQSLSDYWGIAKDAPLVALDLIGDVIVHNKIHTASYALILSASMVFGVLLVRANKKLKEQEEILSSGATYKALVENIGIHSRWPHAAKDGTGAPWGTIDAEIHKTTNSFLYILGANGEDTFGSPSSPLHVAVKDFNNGPIRVILMDPNCETTKNRAASVGRILKEYKKCIQRSMNLLRELKKSGKSVDARYYNGTPNWKLIITSELMWLQYYTPGGPDVEKTPVIFLQKTNSPYSLYNLFLKEFERIWDRCKAQSVNL